MDRAQEAAQQELAPTSSVKGKERAPMEAEDEAGPSKLSADERLAKMKQLRQRMVSEPPRLLPESDARI